MSLPKDSEKGRGIIRRLWHPELRRKPYVPHVHYVIDAPFGQPPATVLAEIRNVSGIIMRLEDAIFQTKKPDLQAFYSFVLDYSEFLDTAANELIKNALDNFREFQIPDGQIDIDASIQDGNLKFSVSDNGTGVPKDEVPRLFNIPFSTKQGGLYGAEGTVFGGSGHGLYDLRIDARKKEETYCILLWIEKQNLP